MAGGVTFAVAAAVSPGDGAGAGAHAASRRLEPIERIVMVRIVSTFSSSTDVCPDLHRRPPIPEGSIFGGDGAKPCPPTFTKSRPLILRPFAAISRAFGLPRTLRTGRGARDKQVVVLTQKRTAVGRAGRGGLTHRIRPPKSRAASPPSSKQM